MNVLQERWSEYYVIPVLFHFHSVFESSRSEQLWTLLISDVVVGTSADRAQAHSVGSAYFTVKAKKFFLCTCVCDYL